MGVQIYDVVWVSIHTTCGMDAHLYHIVGLSMLDAEDRYGSEVRYWRIEWQGLRTPYVVLWLCQISWAWASSCTFGSCAHRMPKYIRPLQMSAPLHASAHLLHFMATQCALSKPLSA